MGLQVRKLQLVLKFLGDDMFQVVTLEVCAYYGLNCVPLKSNCSSSNSQCNYILEMGLLRK